MKFDNYDIAMACLMLSLLCIIPVAIWGIYASAPHYIFFFTSLYFGLKK